MTGRDRKADIIRTHVSARISGMLAQASALGGVEHRVTKGKLRELLLWDLLVPFLPPHLGLSSGIIVNASGEPHGQSNQSDIVIYDGRMLGPFVRQREIGIVPAISVIAVVEVKSNLTKSELRKAQDAAGRTRADICATTEPPPIMCAFGFEGRGPAPIRQDDDAAKTFLEQHASHLTIIALAGRFSWIKYPDERKGAAGVRSGRSGWTFQAGDPTTHEEIKRFIAVLLDNCRTVSDRRWHAVTGGSGECRHHDWLSEYIRDQ